MGSDWPRCGVALHPFCSFPTRYRLRVVYADSPLAESDGVLGRTEGQLTCGSFFLMTRLSFTAVSQRMEFGV